MRFKKMEIVKWIKKYSGMLQERRKTSSMETLIESISSKTVNYAYNYSSAITDDECVNAAAASQQRPMLPPPQAASQDAVPPTPTAQHPNDIYDCCVLLDGIPIKHEFQYTLSNVGGRGKITKDDIEGLALKILESMYGTTAKFSSDGQRTVTVTLNVIRQPLPVVSADGVQSAWNQLQPVSRERKSKTSSAAAADKQQSESLVAVEAAACTAVATAGSVASAELLPRSDYPTHCPVKKVSSHHRAKPEMRWYNKRDELIRLLQKNLAESLSFQNLRKSNRPEGYQRVRSKRRQSVSTSVAGTLQTTPLPSPPTSVFVKPRQPAKVDWSPYDFEPAAHIPSHHYHHQQRKNARNQHYQQQQQKLYGGKRGGATGQRHVEDHLYAIKSSPRAATGRQHCHGAVVISSKSKDAIVAEEHAKDMNHQRYKRAKMALKKLHHHTHEHHHYHHYDFYNIV